MSCHKNLDPVPAGGEPCGERRLRSGQVAIRYADVLKAELVRPPFDFAAQRGEIGARRSLDPALLHSPHLNAPVLTRPLANEAATLALGAALAPGLAPGMVVYLIGELGAGKTTLARGILRGMGFRGRVKSPTFTLVEVYQFSSLYFYHFDFYRFDRHENVTDAGFREYFGPHSICLVEWPEKASGLPPPDLRIALAVSGAGRTAELHADTEAGRLCIANL
jgi:tRNA threonylcarbamoyladenosine biosynthesis protein TsaE